MSAHSHISGNRGLPFFLMLVRGLVSLLLIGLPGLTLAIDCGDTIGPGDLDVLDSDLECDPSLTPVALTIEGPVAVDLNESVISCVLAEGGSLIGTGIEVIGANARIRNGLIENCNRGVVVGGDGRHALNELTVTSREVTQDEDNPYDQGIGFQVLSSDNRLIRNTVSLYAGEGFRLGEEFDEGAVILPANQNLLTHNVASNNRDHAFRVKFGQWNLLLGNVAEHNTGRESDVQGEGFRSQDSYNKFIANSAIGNGDEGIRIRGGEKNLVLGNYVEGNGLVPCNPFPPDEDANPGIAITSEGARNRLIYNTVEGNCIGIFVDAGSLDNKIIKNTALENGNADIPFGLDLVDLNPNCDNNRWRQNEFENAAGPDLIGPPECIR